MHSQTFIQTLNVINNIAKLYSNFNRIRSIMKNAIIIKMNIVENSKKQRNLNISIQNLFQILIKKYDDATFFTIEFLSRLNLIRTNRELKYKFNDFFTTNRAKILFNIFNVFSNFFYVLSNVSNRSTNELTISLFFFVYKFHFSIFFRIIRFHQSKNKQFEHFFVIHKFHFF